MAMRSLIAAAVLVAGSPAVAQTVNIEDYAAAPAAWDVRVSDDGTRIAMGCSPGGLRRVCILDLSGAESPIVVPLPNNARIDDFYWANDRYVIVNINFTTAINGINNNEPFRVGRGMIFDTEEQDVELLMSNYRNVTNTTDVVSLNLDDPETVITQLTFLVDDEAPMGSNVRRQADYETHLFRVDLDNGRARRIRGGGGSVSEFLVDPQGEIAGQVNMDDDSGRFSVYLDGREVYSDQSGVARPGVWLMDGGQAVGLQFYRGDNEGLYRVTRDGRQLEPILYEGEPVTGASPMLDRWTGEVVGFTYYEDHLIGQAFIDEDLEGLRTSLDSALGDARVRLLSWSRERRVFALVAESPGRPRDFYIYNRDSGEVSYLQGEAPALAEATLGTVLPFTFAASDGLDIPGYVTLPAGRSRSDGPFPLVVMPHGGPAGRDTIGYDWWAQYLAANGYAVAQVNFRGSGGLSASFREAGYGGFGTRMIDDIAEAAAYLEGQGIAAPGGYCAVGASYGGYASLMLALRDREAAGCIIGVNAVTEPINLFGARAELSTAYWEQYIGTRYMSAAESAPLSPVRRAGEITAPVLLVWSDEDTTVPPEQSLALVRAMEDGGNISGYIIPGEDHYLGATVARQQVLEQTLGFVSEHHPVQ